jgi:hypothetical protein
MIFTITQSWRWGDQAMGEFAEMKGESNCEHFTLSATEIR